MNKTTTRARDSLIFKYPFHNPLFQESDLLLDWPFSSTILITSYDLFKNDALVSKLQRTGGTLREMIHDFGFNKKIKILADTGVFEFEARKAKMDLIDLNEEVVDLPRDDIYLGYDLIDPDYLVSPDQMVLLGDSKKEAQQKLMETLNNLEFTLDRFERKKVFATIQGLSEEDILCIVENIEELGVDQAARGGLLPLRRADRELYARTLSYSEKISREYGISHLHAFGMPGIYSLSEFFSDNSFNTVDTSAIYWYTVRRRYILINGKMLPVRKAIFADCGCDGCIHMDQSLNYPDSGKFMTGLYYHNALMVARIMEKLLVNPNHFRRKNKKAPRKSKINAFGKPSNPPPEKQEYDFSSIFTTASAVQAQRSNGRASTELHRHRMDFLDTLPENDRSSVLVISSCSRTKSKVLEQQPQWKDLESKGKRNAVLRSLEKDLMPARELYRGHQHHYVLQAVDLLRSRYQVDHYILSAGFGLVEENTLLPPYDSTFNRRDKEEIAEMSKKLGISSSLRQLAKKGNYDLVYLALSRTYQQALPKQHILSELAPEVVIFGKPREYVSPFSAYTISEFKHMQKERHFKYPIYKQIDAKGIILLNYALSLTGSASREPVSFTRWWHRNYGCNCQE